MISAAARIKSIRRCAYCFAYIAATMTGINGTVREINGKYPAGAHSDENAGTGIGITGSAYGKSPMQTTETAQ